MSQVIEILKSLGIDSTVFYQFGIFFFAYLSMNYIVFKPYLKAYDERQKRTVGGQEEAKQLLEEAQAQEDIYKEKARELNHQIKNIFGEKNAQARNEVEGILTEAKQQAEAEMDSARKELETAVVQVRKEMDDHIPTISKDIEQKFVRLQ